MNVTSRTRVRLTIPFRRTSNPRHPLIEVGAFAIGAFDNEVDAQTYHRTFLKVAIVDFADPAKQPTSIRRPEARIAEGRTIFELTGTQRELIAVGSARLGKPLVEIELGEGVIDRVMKEEFKEDWILDPKVIFAEELGRDLDRWITWNTERVHQQI